jgi:hypothetical protein
MAAIRSWEAVTNRLTMLEIEFLITGRWFGFFFYLKIYFNNFLIFFFILLYTQTHQFLSISQQELSFQSRPVIFLLISFVFLAYFG